ncbi:actin filament-associated protein 1-like 2 isoform X4 [Entelurus aequoreus]|uniref:actin filament-associated protein 1-like 2 isoform X4 n=1 Tax=Entelurus aequoreus TaxID=161455 RepID=UPI002B1D6727|nr:actin filament-associated protein 1-like 2 isoform X4 [Entelurus aequoreus]
MDKQKVLSKLMWDLQVFLSVLDSENLSYMAQVQKKSISQLLSALQTQDTTAEDAEYVIMSCPSSSPSNQADVPQTGVLSSEPDWMRDAVTTVMPRPSGGPIATDDEDEDTYEEAHPYNTARNLERAESDSSYYESYGEEDEEAEHVKDRAHYIQWSASQPCLRPAPESRLCGYLWRRRWLSQWTKQLFIIRNHSLLCYKCARDLLPQTEVNLRGCQLVYKVKTTGRVQHQLKLLLPGSHTLVLGYSSSQQAHEWRKVIEELSEEQNLSGTTSESLWSCRSSAVLTHNDQEDPPSHHNKDKDFLNVLMNCQWQSLLCQVEAELLNMFGEDEEAEAEPTRRRPPQYTLQLRGCEVEAGPDGACSQRITLSVLGDQVAVLEVSSADEKRRWTRLLEDGAAGYRGNKEVSPPRTNTYMDPPLYSNTSLLEHMLHSSQDARCETYANAVLAAHGQLASSARLAASSACVEKQCVRAETQRGVQKLELAGRKEVHLRAGSEVNLAKHNKRSSFRQSLAVCGERAQASLLKPLLLRRSASVKSSLRRSPSSFFIQHKKEWESKAA